MFRKLAIVFLTARWVQVLAVDPPESPVFFTCNVTVAAKPRIFQWNVYEKEPNWVDPGTLIYRLHAALQL